jgi:hypothetical protein
MGLRLYVETPGTSLDGFEVSAGVVDEVMFRYRDVYKDLGFTDIGKRDTYRSVGVSVGMFTNVIAKFKKIYPKWKSNPDFNQFMDFVQDCATWCQKRNSSIDLVIA